MLQSLEHQAGLPIALDSANASLHWPEGVTAERITTRTLAEMHPYIREAGAQASRDPIYTVYRNVARLQDSPSIHHSRLRYDLTLIPPGHFLAKRREFFRTAGHYHATSPVSRIPYPEVYEVISGRAYWLIQRPAAGDPAALEEIYAIEAGPGEKAVMLPGFGHISINAFAEPLIIANWINDTFEYNYQPYAELHGGGYWMVEGAGGDTIEFEPNSSYRSVPELHKLRPREIPELGLLRSGPLYGLVHKLEGLKFLSLPEEFRDILAVDRCYLTVV